MIHKIINERDPEILKRNGGRREVLEVWNTG